MIIPYLGRIGSKPGSTTAAFVFMLIVAIIGIILLGKSSNNKEFPVHYMETPPAQETSLDDSIRHFIHFINVAHPDIVYAQAVLESGNYTSSMFKRYNNLFGMKRASRRANMNQGNTGWSQYDRWEYSIVDYALYQATYMTDDRGRVVSREEYLQKLQASYAEDPQYVNKINKLSQLWYQGEE